MARITQEADPNAASRWFLPIIGVRRALGAPVRDHPERVRVDWEAYKKHTARIAQEVDPNASSWPFLGQELTNMSAREARDTIAISCEVVRDMSAVVHVYRGARVRFLVANNSPNAIAWPWLCCSTLIVEMDRSTRCKISAKISAKIWPGSRPFLDRENDGN